jgi:hypothetical protein
MPAEAVVPILANEPAGVFQRVFFIGQVVLSKNRYPEEFIQVGDVEARGGRTMLRRVFTLSLAAAAATISGCRHDCGGWFTSQSGGTPCQLVGRSDVMLDANGNPVNGAPGMMVPGGVPLVPGGTQLPYPQQNELIPRPGVPVPPAIPTPAPPDGSAILPAPKFGVPVKTTK